MLPVTPLTTLPRYGGMPLVREYRAFVEGGQILCTHPYWPKKSIFEGLAEPEKGQPDYRLSETETLFFQMNQQGLPPEAQQLLQSVAGVFAGDGAWSVDVLETQRGWFVTDMAEAARSYHWDGCPMIERFQLRR
jgi:hypothetical protein